MKERIKKLRKELGLTQQEFANRIGISRGNVATYETRNGSPGSSVINLICREFNVNETWLRTGEGEMFLEKSLDEELAGLFGDVLAENDEFKKQFLSILLQMKPEEWKLVEKKAWELAEKIKKAAPNPMEADMEKAYIAAKIKTGREELEAGEDNALDASKLDDNELTPEDAEELERIRQEMIAKRGRTGQQSALPNANAS